MSYDEKNWRDRMYADEGDWHPAEGELLDRVKDAARRLADQAERLTGGTQIDHRPLPPAGPESQPGGPNR